MSLFVRSHEEGTTTAIPTTAIQPIPNISRVTSIKILGVTISNSLSVCEHVSNTIASCAQSVTPCVYCVPMAC